MCKQFTDFMRLVRLAKSVVVLLITAGVLFSSTLILHAQTEKKVIECEECKPGIALPDEKCRINLSDTPKLDNLLKWNKAEKWAWKQICEGRNADFNSSRWAKKLNPRNPKRERLDPRNSAHEKKWANSQRTLSSSFLRTILLNEPFRSAIPHKGVRISGAFFHILNLSDAYIERPLAIHRSLFKSFILMNRFTTTKFVSFNRSKFDQWFYMSSASIGGNLLIQKAEFTYVDLRRAEVGGHLYMNGSTFKDFLLMTSSTIGGDLLMRSAIFKESAGLEYLRVGSQLDARGATLNILDFTGARIKGDLLLGSWGDKKFEWKGEAPKLTLRNARVSTLQDAKDAWPEQTIIEDLGIVLCTEVGTLPCTKKSWTDETKQLELKLDGFTYSRLGAMGKEVPYDRGSAWFVNWLAPYSPQQYLQLASVLRAAGYGGRADRILYAGRAREHRERKMSWPEWLFLWLLWVFIGYGYGLWNFVALAWVVFFIMVGTFLLRINEESAIRTEELGFWYSLDMLLPVIHLREEHYKVDLTTEWLRRYFYVHKIIGYLLIFFVIAGLTGLIK